MIEYPEELLYSQNHVWVAIEDEDRHLARVGITAFLQEELPEILSVDMPMKEDEFEMDDECILVHLDADEEDDDEFCRIRAPLGGHVCEVNPEVRTNPDLLHMDPYENWLFRMIYDDPGEIELLMPPDKYILYVETTAE